MENPERIIDLLHNKKQTEIYNFLRCAIYTRYPKHEHYLNELNELIKNIKWYTHLLNDAVALDAELIKILQEVADKFGDARRTKIMNLASM